MHTYIHTYYTVSLSLHIYIYIYRERERLSRVTPPQDASASVFCSRLRLCTHAGGYLSYGCMRMCTRMQHVYTCAYTFAYTNTCTNMSTYTSMLVHLHVHAWPKITTAQQSS